MDQQNPYQPPRESGQRQPGGVVHRWGSWVVVLWVIGVMAAIALLDLLFMYIGIWRGTR
jgi:hypothetical protein